MATPTRLAASSATWPTERDPSLTDDRLAEARKRIDHVIVLMLENRSYDHLLAFRGLPGAGPFDPASYVNPVDPTVPGSPGEPPTPSGRHILPKDPPHSHHAAKQQMGRVIGKNDKGDDVYAMDGFVVAYRAKLIKKEKLPKFYWERIWPALIGGGATVGLGLFEIGHQIGKGNWLPITITAAGGAALVGALVCRRPLLKSVGRTKVALAVVGGGVAFTAIAAVGLVPWSINRFHAIALGVGALAGAGAALQIFLSDRKKRRDLTDEERMLAEAQAPNIMHCMPENQAKVLGALAEHFAYCTAWHSSVPGATWPNRNFLHSGTSAQAVDIEVGLYDNPTIFETLEAGATDHEKKHATRWRIYMNGTPQVVVFQNLLHDDRANGWKSMNDLFADIRNGTLPTYAFVEPRHDGGNTNSCHPGNNQRPTNGTSDFARGEELVHSIYAALLANRDVFNRTMLVITFDEHGGFFDHASPPSTVHPKRGTPIPKTKSPKRRALARIRRAQTATRTIVTWFVQWKNAPFDFTRLGMRVPTIIVSPWIKPGPVGETFDHTSVIATLRELFAVGEEPLGQRDKEARPFWDLLLSHPGPEPRSDLPTISPPNYPGEGAADEALPPPESEEDADKTGGHLADQLEFLKPRIQRLLNDKTKAPPAPPGSSDEIADRLCAWTPSRESYDAADG